MSGVREAVAGGLKVLAVWAATAGLAAFLTVRFAARGSGVVVPDLGKLDVKQVRHALARQGLELSVAGEEWSETVPAGCVLTQDPAANARVKRGRRISITLSRGSELVRVPALRDAKLDDVEFLLRQLGLEVASVATVPSSAPKRQVLAQAPVPGTTVTRGSAIQLLVSDGPVAAAFAVPRVIGLPTRDALARLREAGLNIAEVAYDTATTWPDGTIIAQDPAGGFRATAGEEVHLHAARAGAAGGLARYVTFNFTVPEGPAKRVRAVVVDEGGSREVGNDVEEGGSVLRFSTRVQGEAVVQFFVSGALVEERKL